MTQVVEKKLRDSNIELFRILTMLVIIAHHYVVNSGDLSLIREAGATASNSLFLLLFGRGGKTGINCFVLITGYFMVNSRINLRKILKLVLEIEFYNIIIALILTATKNANYTTSDLIIGLCPIESISNSFISCFLVFYLFIPFINTFLKAIDERQHRYLIGLCILIFSLMPIIHIDVKFNYVEWFAVLYIIAAYIRLHPHKLFQNKKICSLALLSSIACSWATVFLGAWRFDHFGKQAWYTYVSDSNAILALTTAVTAFLFFRNLNIGYSKIINTVSASTFGVLLIHANSGYMREWLWHKTLQNTSYFHSDLLALHAIGSVLGIFVTCTILDFLRIQLLEKPFFKWLDRFIPSKN